PANRRHSRRNAVSPSTVRPRLLCSAYTFTLKAELGSSVITRPRITRASTSSRVSQCRAMLGAPQRSGRLRIGIIGLRVGGRIGLHLHPIAGAVTRRAGWNLSLRRRLAADLHGLGL